VQVSDSKSKALVACGEASQARDIVHIRRIPNENPRGQKTLEQANMKLRKIPRAPQEYDIMAVPLTKSAFRTLRRSQGLPEVWLQYLSRPSP